MDSFVLWRKNTFFLFNKTSVLDKKSHFLFNTNKILHIFGTLLVCLIILPRHVIDAVDDIGN